MTDEDGSPATSRRDFLGQLLMWGGLVAAYGVLGIEGLLFLLPKRVQPATRRLFAGSLEQYKVGSVQSFFDLQGSEILVRRSETGMKAFSTVCPHLGCRVHWEADNRRFFCPCHRGVFDENGNAIAGPPKDANQNLPEVPVSVDEDSDVVYLEVRDV
ncbi:MAG: ubiquinol-cytochrome c reductase iron-sulfur subunit [Anaerolineae bacterium]